MNVLSLFDGISCGRLALQRAGIKVDKYFASEIDKYTIKVTQENFPDTVQLGDVTKWNTWELPKIDLLMGGSPCQGFSFAGKQLNFEDPRSKLFFEYVDILRYYKPKYFLLENVKMKQEYQDVISSYLGVQPIEINSSLVSAQNRKRLYWTNIPNVTQPKDKGILFGDIMLANDEDVDTNIPRTVINSIPTIVGKYNHLPLLFNPYNKYKVINKAPTQTTGSMWTSSRSVCIFKPLVKYTLPLDKTIEILNKETKKCKIIYKKQDNVYISYGKDVFVGRSDIISHLFRCIMPVCIEELQNRHRVNEITKFYTLTAQDKYGILVGGYIRKLTPVECERLQTVPDNYTSCISNSQRYKCLGNGWTVDVIAHILGGISHD